MPSIRINEHDSKEELSSYSDHLSDTALPKEESSPWYPTGKLKNQNATSTMEEKGKDLLPIVLSCLDVIRLRYKYGAHSSQSIE
jgi:hypothetical protein